MADGMNDVRALRVAEIVQDFRDLQSMISQIDAHPTADEYDEEGFVVLRGCLAEGHAILTTPFSPSGTPDGDPEQEKSNLQYIIHDASTRRFIAHRIYLQATAAMRWINTRESILQGEQPTSAHSRALEDNDETMRAELASITDDRVFGNLHDNDIASGRWVDEDPDLSDLSV
ncbi:MAG: hypothetical protein M1828_000812 [Chrysothrix sp. TS-e1954]|nr:MAG: hypothetical protein M1828_000812 [Chrysothrix sp. TS-e1954]